MGLQAVWVSVVEMVEMGMQAVGGTFPPGQAKKKKTENVKSYINAKLQENLCYLQILWIQNSLIFYTP